MKKILIVGTGNISIKHYNNILKIKNKKFDIRFLKRQNFDEKLSSIIKNRVFYGNRDLSLFIPQYIILCSPSSMHLDDILFFQKKYPNAKMFCEKPLSNNCIKIFKKKITKKIYVGYQLRFHKLVLKLKKIIKKKLFGQVLNYQIITGQDVRLWRPNKKLEKTVSVNYKLGGGALLELSHEIDLSFFLFGKIKSITSKNMKTKYKQYKVEDNANVIFVHKNFMGTVSVDMFSPLKKRDIYVTFKNAIIHVDLILNKFTICKKNIKNSKSYILDEHLSMIKNFIEKRSNSSNFADYKTSAYIVKLVTLAKKSSDLSKTISVK